jgi:hypothetical protein
MGSVEIYDLDQKKWVPYVPDFKKWEQHFEDISEGRVRPDHKGRYVVGSGSRANSTRDTDRPKVTLVTPVAQAVEMAKSELQREHKVIRGSKRRAETPLGPPGKRLKDLQKKNGYRH